MPWHTWRASSWGSSPGPAPWCSAWRPVAHCGQFNIGGKIVWKSSRTVETVEAPSSAPGQVMSIGLRANGDLIDLLQGRHRMSSCASSVVTIRGCGPRVESDRRRPELLTRGRVG